MTTANGRNVKVDIALTYATPIVVTAASKANPGVATATGHGLANGTVGHWSVPDGMVELHEQATRVKATAANTFELQALDTTSYTTFVAGTYTPVATWATLTEAAGYQIGGGAASAQDDTRLIDSKTRNVNGLLGAQNVTIDVKSQTVNAAAMAEVERLARTSTAAVFRITLHDGSVRVFYGTPSMPGESLAVGQLGTGQFAITVPQWVLKGAA